MMHFAFDRHAEVTEGVFMDHSFNTLLSKKIWILKWLREFEIGTNNWPAWMHAYLEHY